MLDMTFKWRTKEVEELVASGAIAKPLDGNHGAIHPKTLDFVPVGVPFIMASDLEAGRVNLDSCSFISEDQANTLRKGFARTGDVLISHKATIGRTAIVQESKYERIILTPQVTYYRILDSTQINAEYLKFYFDSPGFQHLLSVWAGAGSTRAYLGITAQMKLPIVCPPIDTQDAIAKVVRPLNDKIELNRRMNRTLEAMAQAIFKSWFVDFEPVKAKAAAKAAGASPEEIERAAMATVAGKTEAELDQLPQAQKQSLAKTAALFPDAFQESELGEIPDGWNVQSAENATRVAIGKTPPRKETRWFSTDSTDNRWVSIRDMGTSGVFLQTTSEMLTDEAVAKFNVKRIPDRSVLLSFKLTIGRVVIADGEIFSNEAIAHLVPKGGSPLSAEFLYLYLKSFDYASLGSTSSIATAVNSKTIRGMPILLPSNGVATAFEKLALPFFQKIRLNQSEIATLGVLRDTLLPKLLKGEIEVAPFQS